MSPWMIAIAAAVLILAAEAWHARRLRRLGHLAFGPVGRPRVWTVLTMPVRAAAVGLLVWGLLTLHAIDPRITETDATKISEQDQRRILILLDVSPSMQLTDAGIGRKQTRARRASDVLMNVLNRVDLKRSKVSVIAFYSGAKPIVTDAADPNVVRNILTDLPLDHAFDHGKTKLFDGIAEGFTLAKDWPADSVMVVLASDGDTVSTSGMPAPPQSIAEVLVVGVGDPRAGSFIDGHTSRQDISTLRQVANRLAGAYYDCNDRYLPTSALQDLSSAVPLRREEATGLRELAIAATALGAGLLALVSPMLALFGSAWQARPLDSEVRTSGRPMAEQGAVYA